ncbi:hypothetical protein SDC9_205938 [bioreactor metagenome]|uniref:Uncharacterized protein n=1 Tax=bioreactor metagenome TaxID=1076179 RepID=A0A645J3E1_9ZZZZ
MPALLEALFQALHIAVLVHKALGLAQPDAVNDACMVKFVADDCILCAQQRFEQGAVCIETGGEQNRIVGSQKGADAPFQILVQCLGAADEPHRGESIAPLVHGVLGSLDDFLVIRKAEVIVCTKIQNLSSLNLDAAALGAC